MEKRKLLRLGAGISIAVVVFLIFGLYAFGTETPLFNPIQSKPDAITIDTLKHYKKLERPIVVFLHDRHTEALEKKNKDCATCHLSRNDRLSPMYMRLEEANQKVLMDTYHSNCISCHAEMLSAEEKTGPVECGECHREKLTILSSRVPMGFDKSLHFRHSKTQKEKCESCHHEYDQKSKKLIYTEGNEGTCRYCHKKKTEEIDNEKRISMRLASHLSCVDCHLKTMTKNMDAGPVECAGCHELEQQKMIEKVDNIPRMQRKQPDVVLVKTDQNKDAKAQMYRVPFSHKAHEEYNDTCRVCHHADLKSCSSCHTLTGSKEGDQVKLEKAMHQLDTKKSCMGCHAENKQDENCSGCHTFMEKNKKRDELYCFKCHMTPLPQSTGDLSKDEEIEMARLMPKLLRDTLYTNYQVKVPEKVTIKVLENKYGPVELPHGKIIQALKEKIKNNSLAIYFHVEEFSVCQGCHHNSPASKQPPRCGYCHEKQLNTKNPLAPGLMGAYHQKCMICHNKMGIEKPVNVDCTGCHKEKTKS